MSWWTSGSSTVAGSRWRDNEGDDPRVTVQKSRSIHASGAWALVRLPSGETRKVDQECWASIGQIGNVEHEHESIGKAGRNIWKGWRPTVRGVAMNPVDHPHGGGEGKTSGGRPSCTPWGVPTKGKKTRNNPRTDAFIVRRRK